MQADAGDEGEEGSGAGLPSPGEDTRCGFVALVGAPNAGKSTLINRLVGMKVSIVTHKVQTTRSLVRGIAMFGDTQIVLLDTPGIFKPRRKLDAAMVTAAWSGATDADLVALLVDARKGIDEEVSDIVGRLADMARPAILILNKVDTLPRENLLKLAADLDGMAKFERVFMISAMNGDGVGDLETFLAERMPRGPWHYPADQVSDVPLRSAAAEITREKLFLRLHDELPYASTVETEEWKVLKDGSVRIEQTIYVERESQRKIVLGHKGETIRAISMLAREEIAEMAETKVHLFLFVKVRAHWGQDPERYRAMGLEPPRR
jgi:GTPase